MKLLLTSLALAGLMFIEQRVPVGPIRPTVLTNGIQPSQGPISGGTVATVTGNALTGATVAIDGQRVTPAAQTDTSIALTMPPHDNGYVVVTVTGGDGTTAYHRFLYVPPRLDEIPAGAITTVAGVGTFKGDFGPALEANLDPNNLVFDPQGNIYLAEANFAQVSRIRTDGVIERVAGNGLTPRDDRPCCGDGGPATQALLGFPRGVALEGDGNLLIGEDANRIRRVNARTGVITTVAGTSRSGFSGDGGPATSAQITQAPRIVVFGTAIFFLDFGNARIRRIGPDGRISTIAGNGIRGFSGDGGQAVSASLDLTFDSDGTALAVDSNGNLFLVEGTPGRIRRIDAQTGIISTFYAWAANGVSAQGVAVDRDGNVYVSASPAILKISPSGSVLKSWGIGPSDFSPDGTLLEQLHFGIITGITVDAAGNLVISDQPAGRVRRLNFSTNRIETIAGTAPEIIGDQGPAVGAALRLMNGDIALTRSGDLLIADMRVRRVNAQGMIRTIAGNAFGMGAYNNKTNVPALNYWNGAIALFVGPTDEIDTASFASPPYHIDSRGIAQMIVGGARCASLGDGGAATLASLCQSWDITRDRDGNVFIVDTNNNRIRRVDARNGTISTVVGSGPSNGFENPYPGKGTFCGDGGPAVNACLATPGGIAFDPDGNLFVADTVNRRIRRVDRVSGIITTFAVVPNPRTIRFDRQGYLYVNLADRLVRFDRNGDMGTVAGTAGSLGFSGDGGPALQARIDMGYAQSAGIAINDAGDVFFVDAGNRRVRVVKSGALLAATVTSLR